MILITAFGSLAGVTFTVTLHALDHMYQICLFIAAPGLKTPFFCDADNLLHFHTALLAVSITVF
jgi:hypothetical protein